MSAPRDRLMVFTRYPEPGRTKTRLIPALGADGAAELARRLASHVLAQAAALAQERAVDVEVWFEGGDEQALAACYGATLRYQRQQGADLGERMLRAFEQALAHGAGRRAVLVGTDCPALSTDLLASAFDGLAHSALVLGPARDGGYYLIGLKRAIPDLFSAITWGTSSVRQQTLAIAEGLGLSVTTLALLDDIDRPADLLRVSPQFMHDPAEPLRPGPQD